MKKLTILIVFAISLATSAIAQNWPVNNDPISLNLRAKKQDTTYSLLTQFMAANTYVPNTLSTANIETAAVHNYTVTGKYLVVVSTTNNDTINLVRAKYATNQLINFVSTNSGNDSTVIIPDHGTINGANTYKRKGQYTGLVLWMDGTNYWTLSSQ